MREIGEIIWSIGLVAWLFVFIIPLIRVGFNFREWLYKVNIQLLSLSCAVVWIGISIMLIADIL